MFKKISLRKNFFPPVYNNRSMLDVYFCKQIRQVKENMYKSTVLISGLLSMFIFKCINLMHEHMFIIVTPVTITFPTHWTTVRFLSCVKSKMCPQSGTVFQHFPAVLTDVTSALIFNQCFSDI